MLKRTSCGFGSLALSAMMGQDSLARSHPLAPKETPITPRAKRVIFIFMQGGPSHVDSYDYKPRLVRDDGKSIQFKGVRFQSFGKVSDRELMKPLWDFKQYGECGQWVSELFPETAQHVDDLCMIHGMQTEGVAHGPATLFLHTGATNLVRPSVGSWINYGLGSANRNLPGFVTVSPTPAKGGPRNYGNAFLPTIYQGTPLGEAGLPSSQARISHLANREISGEEHQRQFDFLQGINREQLKQAQHDDAIEAAIESYELAYRMQCNAPEILDMGGESRETLSMYGIDQKHTEDFGRQCLMARRLAEADVRYIQVNYADHSATPRWDQHSNMPKHMDHARATDKPVAGLLADLKQRGLLEDTLVWWGGEFGRTPYSQGKNGRDHNPRGFTVWLAGGGVKKGFAYGETDDIGHYAVRDKVHMHDLHATILHLLGLHHEQLTYKYAGRDFRLTDVAGNVVHEIFA
jgi:hypothetical protein